MTKWEVAPAGTPVDSPFWRPLGPGINLSWGINQPGPDIAVKRDGVLVATGGWHYQNGPGKYAMLLGIYTKDWWDDKPFPVVSAVASFCSLDPAALDMHVEGGHGFEPHDEGYDEAVWRAAGCLLKIRPCSILEEK